MSHTQPRPPFPDPRIDAPGEEARMKPGSVTGFERNSGPIDCVLTKTPVHAFRRSPAQTPLDRGIRINRGAIGHVPALVGGDTAAG